MRDSFIHVIDAVSEEASGPSYSVPRLCEALAAQRAAVQLLTVGDMHLSSFQGVRHRAYPADFANVPVLGRLRFSSSLRAALARGAATASIIHAHGLWRMANIYPASEALRAKKHLVLSPRGMLGDAALKFSARLKQVFWSIAQGRAVRAATCLHATSRQEYEDIRAFGLKAPVAIIPNGVDIPSPKVGSTSRHRTLLYLGRLHPKKGLDQLLDAWEIAKVRHPDWQLDIVGPNNDGYAKVLQARIDSMQHSQAHLVGPLYGDEKWQAYRSADLFVLPSLNENFAMTVAEALAHGTPVISTKGAPWPGLITHGCGWWVDQGIEPLASAMDQAMSRDRDHLAAMGEAGRAWMRRDFDWRAIAESMLLVYRWVSEQGERPSCVILD